jgi:DNA-binding transcriptional ArsR family regulator
VRREIDDLSFAYRGLLPEFLTPEPGDDYATFPDELARMRALPPNVLAFAFVRPLYDHGGERDPATLANPAVREHMARRAAALGARPDLALLALDDPAALADRFARLLEAYWQAAFAAEWEALEPRLADAVTEAGRLLAADGLYPFLARLAPALRVDLEREEFGLDLPHEHTVAVTAERPLVLVPSAYTWPHVHVNCDEPWPLAIVYAAPFVTRDARAAIPPAELTRVLKALADDTRLRALQLIAQQPRTTQELAPLIGLSEAGLSKHLRQLAAAGLVRTQREGYYILYRAEPESIAPVSEALLSYLHRSG